MAEIPSLVEDLALILVVAGVVTLIFKKLKQPLVLGYIMAGFLVSPHMPLTASVADTENIQTWADIGVMFLLFSLGLIIATLTIIFAMMILGNGVGHLFGWESMDCTFLGGMLAMSSTTIIYKAFDDLGLRQQRFSGLVMSVLILEDILDRDDGDACRHRFRQQSCQWTDGGFCFEDRIFPCPLVCGGHLCHSLVPACYP